LGEPPAVWDGAGQCGELGDLPRTEIESPDLALPGPAVPKTVRRMLRQTRALDLQEVEIPGQIPLLRSGPRVLQVEDVDECARLALVDADGVLQVPASRSYHHG